MFFRIMMLWLCQKPRIRKVSEVSDVVVFQKLQMQNLSHGYGVFAFQKVCERENVSQAYVIFAFAEAGKRYASQGYGEVVFLEAAKDKCQFGLCCCGFHSSRKREMLFTVTVSQFSQKPRERNVSYGYGVLAFQEAAKEKCQLGLWFRGFSTSREREMLVSVKVLWLSQRPQKRNVSQDCDVDGFVRSREQKMLVKFLILVKFSQGYFVFTFPKLAKEKILLGLWCHSFPRSREREMLDRDMVSRFSQILQMRNVCQGYGIIAFPEVAKQKCKFRLWCRCL